MQLLELSSGELGVLATGIYVVDEGQHVLAGPFAEVSDAILWIDHNAVGAAWAAGARSSIPQSTANSRRIVTAHRAGPA
jgi:hypothetical protein